MTAEQSLTLWGLVICFIAGVASSLLLYWAFLCVRRGTAEFGSRRGSIGVSRRTQPIAFWCIVELYILFALMSALISCGMYYKCMSSGSF